MIVVTRTSRFTRGFVNVTKSAQALELDAATAALLVISFTACLPISYSLFPIVCFLQLFHLAAGFAHFAKHPIFHPLLIPPFDRIHRMAVDEHREVQMVAAGKPRHA